MGLAEEVIVIAVAGAIAVVVDDVVKLTQPRLMSIEVKRVLCICVSCI